MILTRSCPRDCELIFFIGRGSAELQNQKKVKMARPLELWRILWWNFAYPLILTRCSQWDCQMTFGIGRDFAEIQILNKWNWPYLLNLWVYFDKIVHTHGYWHDLDSRIAKSRPRDCKMTFNIGRGCAELQILKKWKWPNWVDSFDETLHTHWYWQDVTQEIVKCHWIWPSRLLEHFDMHLSKFWKKSKTEKDITHLHM